MAKILYVKASALTELSFSIAVANAFIDECKKKDAQCEVDVLDLFAEKLPEFDAAASRAKYAIMHGHELGDEDKLAWASIVAVIERFKAANKYVFAVPMWNFGVPYNLKHFLDVIVQPGHAFSFDPQKGYRGLVKGKRSLVVYARGGDYSVNKKMDHQQRYMEQVLGFMGFENVKSIVVEPTQVGGPAVAERKRDAAINLAKSFAHGF